MLIWSALRTFSPIYDDAFWRMLLTIFTEITVWKKSKYGVFSGSYFPVYGLDTEKYGPEETPYLDSFHAVNAPSKKIDRFLLNLLKITISQFSFTSFVPAAILICAFNVWPTWQHNIIRFTWICTLIKKPDVTPIGLCWKNFKIKIAIYRPRVNSSNRCMFLLVNKALKRYSHEYGHVQCSLLEYVNDIFLWAS